jgi:hypothetical protein
MHTYIHHPQCGRRRLSSLLQFVVRCTPYCYLCTNTLFENPTKSANPTNHVQNTVMHRENHFINTDSTTSDLHATVAHGTMASIDKMNVMWPVVTLIAYSKHSENHCTSFREYHQCCLYMVNFVILIVNVCRVSVLAASLSGINPLNTSGWSLQPVWRNNENMFASSLSLRISKCLLLELIHFGRHKVLSVLSDVVKWACHQNTSAPWLRRSVAGTSLSRPRFDPRPINVRFVMD